jgi:hypothetical protein
MDEFEKMRDEMNYYKNIVAELTKIQNRDTCPHCQQKMPPRAEIVAKITDAQSRVDKMMLVLAPQVEERVRQIHIAAEQRAQEERELNNMAEHMLITRKKDFSRVLRACKSGAKIELPILSVSEKPVWNEAIALYIDRSAIYRDFEDEEELFFKI